MKPGSRVEVFARKVIEPAPSGKKVSGFKLPGLRWWMIGWLMMGSIANYLMRSALLDTSPRMQHDSTSALEQFTLESQDTQS